MQARYKLAPDLPNPIDHQAKKTRGAQTTLNPFFLFFFPFIHFHFPPQAELKEGDRLQDYVSVFCFFPL